MKLFQLELSGVRGVVSLSFTPILSLQQNETAEPTAYGACLSTI